MAVTFKRESNADRRLAQIEEKARIAERLAAEPLIEATCTPTSPSRPSKHKTAKPKPEPRTAGKNITIFRTWRARGRKLGLSAADVKQATAATAEERRRAKTTQGGLAIWASATGKLMVNALRYRIRKEGLVDTGQLLASITFRTKNT